ncbi:MAG: hypothetical protein HYX59_11720 [Elusimicrobia bacterium]|nr:hypothetical protein [Elusimicrobiota bacterium]
MNRTKALVLAAFTVWPVAYMAFFMATVASSFVLMRNGSNQMPSFFGVLIALHFFTMAEMIGLMVFYILHLFRTEEIAQDKKALWAVVLFMGNAIAMPVYWYLYVWTPLRREKA